MWAFPVGDHGPVIDRATVSGWLAALFTSDATYQQSPYEQPVTGLDAIGRMWDEERQGPDEIFTLTTGIVAVDGPTAVVRAEVRYGDPPVQEYRDLWIIRFADDGRCGWFEEWPFWPERPYAARPLRTLDDRQVDHRERRDDSDVD
jgi:SnoaL-like domain